MIIIGAGAFMLYIKEIANKLSLRGKLILFMTSIVISISLINLFLYNNAYSTVNEYNRLLQDYSKVNTLSMTLIQGRDRILKYSSPESESAGDSTELYRYYDCMKQANGLIQDIYKSSDSLDTYLLSKAIKNSMETYSSEINRIIYLKPGSESTYIQFLRVKDLSVYIEGYIKQLLNTKLSEGEWYFQQISNHVKTVRSINLLSVFIIMLLSIIFIITLSNSITIPLKRLIQFARNISHGDFGVKKLELNSSEDIKVLADTLNQVSVNIENMINIQRQLHQEEIKSIKISNELNEARFLALQSQINPHFLFNTLNAIARFAMFEGAKKTTGLIESLSTIFRYNLKGVEKEVLLSEELNIIREYAKIQNARFGGKFKFDIVCRVNIDHVIIPRFIIQPLVENAIIHGLEPKESDGMVRIKIIERAERLLVKIVDNGIGISKEQLKQMLENADGMIAGKGHTTGIGLNNVRERMIMYYKCNECFNIRSKENMGTVIELDIPRNRGGAFLV